MFENKGHSRANTSSENIIELILIHFGSYEKRVEILEKVISNYLSVEFLSSKKTIENLFQFLIDLLHSFSQE